MPTAQDAYDAFAEFIKGDAIAQIMEQEIYEMLMNGITGMTRETALKVAREETGRLIKDIVEGTRQGLAQIIADGLEQQIGIPAIARNLEELIGLNPQRIDAVNKYRAELEKQGLSPAEIDAKVAKFTDQQLRDRAELIAQTEARNATAKGESEVMKERGAKFKIWITSQDGLVSDECQSNEADGWISVDDSFSGGADLPPQHPGCRCTVSYREELSPEAIDRAKARAERTADAKATDD